MLNKNHNPHRRGDVLYSTGTLTFRHFYKTLVLSLFLACFSFVFVPYIIADANAATEVSAHASWLPVSLELNNGGDIAFGDIIPSEASGENKGTMKVVHKTVSVETNGKAVDVYLAMSGSSNALNYADSDLGSSISIPSIGDGETTGVWNSPATFSGKSWGYAVPSTSFYVTAFNSLSSFTNTFTLPSGSVSSGLVAGDSGYNGETWAAIPVSTPQKIWSVTTSNVNGFGGEDGDNEKNNFDVYYAVMADTSLIAGNYSNSVVYTALASSNSIDAVSNNINVTNVSSNGITTATKRYTTNGDELELKFDLAQSQSGLITRDNVSIYLVPHADVGKTVNLHYIRAREHLVTHQPTQQQRNIWGTGITGMRRRQKQEPGAWLPETRLAQFARKVGNCRKTTERNLGTT